MKPFPKLTACIAIVATIFFSCKKNKSIDIKIKEHPVANAGFTKIAILPVDSVELSGSGTDTDGFIVSYAWSNVSGPPSFMIMNPNIANTKVKNIKRGIYEFELKVTDNDGLFNTDRATVMVLDSLNDPLNASCAGCWDY